LIDYNTEDSWREVFDKLQDLFGWYERREVIQAFREALNLDLDYILSVLDYVPSGWFGDEHIREFRVPKNIKQFSSGFCGNNTTFDDIYYDGTLSDWM
jgi:hypothetical protein